MARQECDPGLPSEPATEYYQVQPILHYLNVSKAQKVQMFEIHFRLGGHIFNAE